MSDPVLHKTAGIHGISVNQIVSIRFFHIDGTRIYSGTRMMSSVHSDTMLGRKMEVLVVETVFRNLGVRMTTAGNRRGTWGSGAVGHGPRQSVSGPLVAGRLATNFKPSGLCDVPLYVNDLRGYWDGLWATFIRRVDVQAHHFSG
jgi:hypothetical protein